MSDPEPRLSTLLRLLSDRDIRFVLVGGLAVGAWGGIRATDDIDLVPDPDAENLDRLAELLDEHGGKVIVGGRHLAGDAIKVFLRSGDMVLVSTNLGQVDVLQGVTHIPRYAEILAESELADLAGSRVRVCSLRHLEQMKRAGGRHQDLSDLEALRAAHPEFDWLPPEAPDDNEQDGT